MDRYRNPQSLSGAALTIGAPRPLRPHGEDRLGTPLTRADEPLAHTPVIPQMPGTFPIAPQENESLPEQAGPAAQPRDVPDDVHASKGGGTSFFGGLLSGLRRVPRAMQKHHSRQSLYEEYVAEAQASARARFSQMSPNSGECFRTIHSDQLCRNEMIPRLG